MHAALPTARTARRTAAAAALAIGAATALAPAAGAWPSTDSLGPPPAGCAVNAQQVADDTPPPPGMNGHFTGWTVTEVSDPCGNLGYILLDTAHGTGSSLSEVLLYHRGAPLPTQPVADLPATVTGHSDFHVVVRQWTAPPPGVPNAEAPHTDTVFVWNPFTGDVTPFGV